MANHSKVIENEKILVEQVQYAPGLYMAPHKDPLSRISIIIDGEMHETVKHRKVNAGPGSFVIKPSSTIHENSFSNKPVNLLTICFKDEEVFTRHFNNWEFVKHPKNFMQAIRLWTELRKAKTDKELTSFFSSFAGGLNDQHPVTEYTLDWIKTLKEMLTRDLSEPEKVSAIAKKLSLHRVYAGRSFKKQYGISPSGFRKYTRIATAFLEIAGTKKSLAAIAFDTGFADQSHMSRELRQLLGCSPASLRKLIND